MTSALRNAAIVAAVLSSTLAAAGGGSSDLLMLLTTTGVVDARERSKVDAGGAVFVVLPARGRDLAGITHVAIFRNPQPGAGVVVASRQVFATHYLTGSLSLTLITDGVDGAPRYLVYLRRSRTDAFAGAFGTIIRHVVEGRIRSEAPAVLDALRRTLEAGEPRDADFSGQLHRRLNPEIAVADDGELALPSSQDTNRFK